jgi:hypothetical protein
MWPVPGRRLRIEQTRKARHMMEIQWGEPVALLLPQDGEIQRFSTIEKVRYWLRRKWPVSDAARQVALNKVESAMDCMSPVEDARHAFLAAALSAGFVPEHRA